MLIRSAQFLGLVHSLVVLAACASPPATQARASGTAIQAHVEFLADDLLEGRETGTRGHDIAARYVAGEFARAGLLPGGDSRTFMQRMTLTGTQLVAGTGVFELAGAGALERYQLGEDFAVPPSRHAESTDATADAVYAGHGIVAPHRGVDDYAGLDVRGKFVLVLAGSPRFFSGDEIAHFSNPRLKQEAAAARGAIGLITLQTPANEAQLPFAQIVRQLQLRTFAWIDADGKPQGSATALQHLATLSPAGAEKLLARAGAKIADLVARAEAKLPPSALAFGARVRIAGKSRLQAFSSANVVGLIEGSDPALKHETIVMTAHLDHLGVAAGTPGDKIHNGTLDNAMGVAVMTEAARVIASLPARPRRSIAFVATTAEEAGLLGSEYFVNRAQAARLDLVANLNVDMPILHYDFLDICAFGAEHSSLWDTIAAVGKARGVPLSADPNPERRRFTRSDQYSFVKAGIPAAFLNTGLHSMTQENAGQKARNEFEARHYHRVSDDASLPFDYAAAARFSDLGAAILIELANASMRPEWKAGNFFSETFGKRGK